MALPKPTPSSFLASPIQSPSALGGGGKAWKPLFGLVEWTELVVPSAIAALLVNVVTQGICVRGVNRLTSVSLARSWSSQHAVSIFRSETRHVRAVSWS